MPSGLVLKRLYVEPALWGSDIGPLLHDWAIDHAAAGEVRGLNLWVLEANTRARRMYQSRGWRHVPGPTLPNDDPTIVVDLYERPIP